MNKDIAEAILENPNYNISVSGDIAHKLDEDDLGVRVFSSNPVETIVEHHRKEITIVMETADLNFKLAELLEETVGEAINNAVDAYTKPTGELKNTERLKKRLKKDILLRIAGRLNQ